MNKTTQLITLLTSMIGSTTATAAEVSATENSAHAGSNRWNCYVANDAQERKNRVENGILPQVVFDGEIKPAHIEMEMADAKTPAFSVAVIHNGELDWSATWGRLNSGGPQANCGSLFQAGSLAKPLTVLAAMRIKTAGHIDFDRDIETYLSSYELPVGQQTSHNPVTFRNLFSHTSGVARGGYAGYAKNQPLPSDQQIASGETPANSPRIEVSNSPGSGLAYSGGGYTVAEIALQDTLRKPFEQIMHEWLITPLAMKQAAFTVPLPDDRHAFTASGHHIDGTMVPGGWNNHPEQAAAGLWATATDLAMFLIEMHKGYDGESDAFTQSDIHELLANPIQNHVYGFRQMAHGDQVFLTHYGGTVGYRAGMTVNLQTGDGAVFLSNSENASNLGEAFLSAVSRTYNWPVFQGERVKRKAYPAEALKSLAGTYFFSELGWELLVSHEHNNLKFDFPAGNRLPLIMKPIQSKHREFVHETGVHAYFVGEGPNLTIKLFGQTGQRQLSKQ